MLFPLKLCEMDKDGLGQVLADDLIVHPADGDLTLIRSGREIFDKILGISGGIMSLNRSRVM